MTDGPEQSAPKSSSSLPLIIVVVAAIAIAAGWYFLKGPKVHTFEREGTVTFIDYAKRNGELELPDPKGGMMTVNGEFSSDCKFLVDGKPATLKEIAAGDRVRVKAKLEKRKTPDGKKVEHFTATSVSVLHEGS